MSLTVSPINQQPPTNKQIIKSSTTSALAGGIVGGVAGYFMDKKLLNKYLENPDEFLASADKYASKYVTKFEQGLKKLKNKMPDLDADKLAQKAGKNLNIKRAIATVGISTALFGTTFAAITIFLNRHQKQNALPETPAIKQEK